MAEKAPLVSRRVWRLARSVAFVLVAAFAAGAAQAKDQTPDLTWVALDASQREILAPLADEWARLDPDSRKRWLGVALRYPKMTPIGQKRVNTRIGKWAALTPQQRAEARARYKRMRQQRQMKRLQLDWQRYQALSAEEREALIASEKRKQRRNKTSSSPAAATGKHTQ